MATIDWSDPCARAAALWAAYNRLISGAQESDVTYSANGVNRRVSYSNANLDRLLNEYRAAENECALQSGKPVRWRSIRHHRRITTDRAMIDPKITLPLRDRVDAEGEPVHEFIVAGHNDDFALEVDSLTLVGRVDPERGPAQAIAVEAPLELINGALKVTGVPENVQDLLDRIVEAIEGEPEDGRTYGRKSRDWQAVLPVINGVVTIPEDNALQLEGANARLTMQAAGQPQLSLGHASNGNFGLWTLGGARRFVQEPHGGFTIDLTGASPQAYSIAGSHFDGVTHFVNALSANPSWADIRIQILHLPAQWAGLRVNVAGGAWFDFRNDGRTVKSHPGGWEHESDARIKDIRRAYEAGLEAIKKLQPVRFAYKGHVKQFPNDRTEFVGLTAQNVEDAGLSEFVTKGPGAVEGEQVDDLRAFDPTSVIYTLINAVKELAARVEQLEARA